MSTGMTHVTIEKKRKKNAVRIHVIHGEVITVKMEMYITLEHVMIEVVQDHPASRLPTQMKRLFLSAHQVAAEEFVCLVNVQQVHAVTDVIIFL